jgi:hypothetical protein
MLAVAATAVLGADARAETEQAVSIGIGWASFSTVGEPMGNMQPPALSPTFGGSASLIYERAVGTDLLLRGELVGGLFYGGTDDKKPDQSKTSGALLGDAGVALRFDVLTYVPYAFAGLGAVASGGGPIAASADLVVVVGGGLDWLRSRQRSYGAELRLASFGGDITVFTIGLRGTTRWGFL